jgi:coenzyme PQQ synthesis protein D (PqqD)
MKDGTTRMCVRLAPGILLRGGEESGAQVVLVSPEGNVPLNSVAAEILGLCDGSRERAQVLAEILHRTRNRARSADIVEFLDAAVERGWIQES